MKFRNFPPPPTVTPQEPDKDKEASSRPIPKTFDSIGDDIKVRPNAKTFDSLDPEAPISSGEDGEKEDSVITIDDGEKFSGIVSKKDWFRKLENLINGRKPEKDKKEEDKEEKIPIASEAEVETSYFDAYKKLTQQGGKFMASANAKAAYKKASDAYYKVQNAKIADQQEFVRETRKEDLATTAWQAKMADHYDKLSERKSSVLGKENEPKMSFDEYSEKFSKDFIERGARLTRTKMVLEGAGRHAQAREEALSTKEKGLFDKGLSWAKKKNEQLEKKVGKWGARIVRATAGAAIFMVPAAFAALPVGAVAVVAVGGHGAFRIIRSVIGASASGAIVGRTSMAFQKYIGSDRKSVV